MNFLLFLVFILFALFTLGVGTKKHRIRPHDLRHSFCEWCITNGIDLKIVSSWMRHSDQKMIMQVYDHVTDERETKAVEK